MEPSGREEYKHCNPKSCAARLLSARRPSGNDRQYQRGHRSQKHNPPKTVINCRASWSFCSLSWDGCRLVNLVGHFWEHSSFCAFSDTQRSWSFVAALQFLPTPRAERCRAHYFCTALWTVVQRYRSTMHDSLLILCNAPRLTITTLDLRIPSSQIEVDHDQFGSCERDHREPSGLAIRERGLCAGNRFAERNRARIH